MSTDIGMDKEDAAYIYLYTCTHTHTNIHMHIHTYNGILLSCQKEWNDDICCNMDGSSD